MYSIHSGDCRLEMQKLIDAGIQVDAVITDPPYEQDISRKGWDRTGVAFDPATWRLAHQLLKPGGHLLAFAAARNYHYLAVAVEAAGFEIRDQIMWLYCSGMPKTMDVSKAIDKAAGATRTEVIGVKPGHEGFAHRTTQGHSKFRDGFARDWQHDATARERYYYEMAPVTEDAKTWQGWGTGLRPAHEPILLARKPLSEKTLAANVVAHHTGALHIACSKVADNQRWPANVIHDGSELVSDLFDDGRRAGYFYTAKPSPRERAISSHPTMKPLTLMVYLARLITPTGGTILDMFAGSGTTGEAAVSQGFNVILIEQDSDYLADIEKRMAARLL